MKVLVAISEPISGTALTSALGDDADEAEIMLIAPVLDESTVRFWVSDADEAIARARAVEQESREQLQREGACVVADDIAEGDLTEAIKDALVTYPAERVVLFIHALEEGRYRERVDAEALSYELGLPVEIFRVESPQEASNGSTPEGQS